MRTCLVVQRLRIRLAMQGTWVQSLVQEDSTSCRATKPPYHHYWANAPQLLKFRGLGPVLHKRQATAMRSLCTARKSRPCSPQLKKAYMQQWRPSTAKNKELILESIEKKKQNPNNPIFKRAEELNRYFSKEERHTKWSTGTWKCAQHN